MHRIAVTLACAFLVLALRGADPNRAAEASPREVVAAGDPVDADGSCLPLTAGHGDGNFIVPGVLGEVVYGRAGTTALALDLYAPNDDVRRPLVVVVHGGGWQVGSRVAHVGQLLELLTRAGFAWASIDYRLGGLDRWTSAAEDLRAALRFLRCHAGRAGYDATRLALIGEDAGAQLVGQVAADAAGGVRAAVLIGGFYDLSALPAYASLDGDLRRKASLLGPAGPTRRPHGPTLVIHGSADTESPFDQAEAWCDGLEAAGGRCDLVPVKEGIHRLENWRPVQWDYKARLTSWLASMIGGGTPASAPPVSPRASGALQKDIVFDRGTGLALDAWIPDGPGPHTPVLLAHGGGWEAGDKVTYITPLFSPLARAGVAWFSIDYRLTPDVRHPAQLEDVRAAIRFLKANAARFRIDPARLVLVGESASAQMVSQVGILDGGVAGVISFYGVYDFLPFAAELTPRSIPARLFGITALDGPARETLRRFSPLHRAHRGQPPMLLIHGTAEGLWQQGQRMAARLETLKVPGELFAVHGAPHGMENWEGRPEWQGYKEKVVHWIRALPIDD